MKTFVVELNIFNIHDRSITENKERRITHLNSLPKEVWKYKPVGQRSIGIPRKRWWSVCIRMGPEQVIGPDRRWRRKIFSKQVGLTWGRIKKLKKYEYTPKLVKLIYQVLSSYMCWRDEQAKHDTVLGINHMTYGRIETVNSIIIITITTTPRTRP